MKLLLLLLIPLTLSAEVERCGTKSITSIETCTVEDKLPQLMKRLYPNHLHTTESSYSAIDLCDPETVDDILTEDIVEVCPTWVDPKFERYYFDEQDFDDEGVPEFTLYERLIMEGKPSKDVFDSELLVLASELKDVVIWTSKVINLKDFRLAMTKCGFTYPNIALFKKELTSKIGDSRFACLESKSAEIESEKAYTVRKQKRKKDRAFGDNLVEEVLLLLPDKLPPEVKLPMLANLSSIQTLLQLGDIDGAKQVIEGKEVSPLFSEGLKAFMLGKINGYLGE